MSALGRGLLLGLAAYAVIAIAKSLELNALELWARHSHFGVDAKHRRWEIKAEDSPEAIAQAMSSAIAALNAAVLGMEVALGFQIGKRAVKATNAFEAAKNGVAWETIKELAYRIVLPGYDPANSGYRFTLELERFGARRDGHLTTETSTQVLASGQVNVEGTLATPLASQQRGEAWAMQRQPSQSSPVLQGTYQMPLPNGVRSATLTITYRPDRSDDNGYAEVILTELA